MKAIKLTPKDMVRGIGRKLTEAELRAHLTRPMKEPVAFDRAIEKISSALK